MKQRLMGILAAVILILTMMAGTAQAQGGTTQAADSIVVTRTNGGNVYWQIGPGTNCYPLNPAQYYKVTTASNVSWELHTGGSCSGNVVATGTGSGTFSAVWAGSVQTTNP